MIQVMAAGSLGYTHSFPPRINTVLRERYTDNKNTFLEISQATVIAMGMVTLIECTFNMQTQQIRRLRI